MKYLTILFLLASFVVAQDETPAEKERPKEAEPEKAEKVEAPNPKNPVVVMKTSMGDIEIELFADEAPKTVANFVHLAEGKKEFTDPKTNEKVTRPFYDGLVFHRVIDKFMIQGGCPLGNGTGSPGYKFEDEINAKALGLDQMKVQGENGPHPYLQLRSQQQVQMQIIQPLFKKLGITSQEELDKRKDEVTKALQELTLMQVYENLGYKYDDSHPSHAPNRGVLAMANSGPNTNGSQFFINLVDTPWLTGKHTVFGRVIKGMDVVDKIAKVQVGAGAKPVEDVTIVSVRLKEGSAAVPAVEEKPAEQPEEIKDAEETEKEPEKDEAEGDEETEEPEEEPEEITTPE